MKNMKKIILGILTLLILHCGMTDPTVPSSSTATVGSSSPELTDFNAAVNLFNQANYSSAITSFNSFISNYPSSASLDGAYYYLGRSYFETGIISGNAADYTNAKDNFQVVITNYPQSNYIDNSYYWHGRSYYELGSLNLIANPGQITDPNFTTARTDFQTVLTYPTSTYRDNAQFYMGASYYQESNYTLAISELDTFISDSANSLSTMMDNALYYRGKSHVMLEKIAMTPATFNQTVAGAEYTAAVSDLSLITLTNYPTSTLVDNAQYYLGLAYFYYPYPVSYPNPDYTQSITTFETLITTFPSSTILDNAYYYCGLAHLMQEKNAMAVVPTPDTATANTESTNAITDFNSVFTYPTSSYKDNAQFNKALAYYYNLKYANAVTEFTTFINDPVNSASTLMDNAYYFRGMSHLNLEKNEMALVTPNAATASTESNNAITDFAKVLTYPTSIYRDNSQYSKGLAYYYIADYANAILEFSTMITNYSPSVYMDNAYYYRGRSYEEQGILAMPIIKPATYTPTLDLARADFTTVISYQTSTLIDNAAYFHAITYYDEHNCTIEQSELQNFLANYPNTFYAIPTPPATVSPAWAHINADLPTSAWCWY